MPYSSRPLITISGYCDWPRGRNVSHTGLCLQAAEMLPQGATMEIAFVPPKGETPIRAIGTVVWAHASGRAGLKFNELDPAQQLEPENWSHSEFSNVPLAP